MDALVSRIYDCALEPALWPQVLQDISQRSGAFGAMVFDCELGGPIDSVVIRSLSSVYDAQTVSTYVKDFNTFEVQDQERFAHLSTSGDEVNLIRCDDLTPSRAQLEGQANVQAMMKMGIYYRAGALLSKNTRALDRFALQFRRGQGPIAEDRRLAVQALLPHVAKALSMGRSVAVSQAKNRDLVAVLNLMPVGIAVVNQGGETLFSNTAFGQLADKYNLFRTGQTAKLALERLPIDIQSLLHSARNHGKFGARPLREGVFMRGVDDQLGLFIEVAPVTAHSDLGSFSKNCFVVSMLDSATSHSVDTDILRRYFPLTDTELAVLELVVKGHTNSEIADIRNRSIETVNSQIKAMLLKSSARNRTELVRLAVSVTASGLR